MAVREDPVLTTVPTGTPAIFAAMNRVQRRIAKLGVGKDAKNDHDRYKYRSIDAVLDALSPILAEEGVIPIPRLQKYDVVPRQGRNVTLNHWHCWIAYDFVSAEDGSSITAEIIGEGMDRADKGFNKALAAAFKYTTGQVFVIPYHADIDADSETPEALDTGQITLDVDKAVDAMKTAKDLKTLQALFGAAWNDVAGDAGQEAKLQGEYEKLKAHLVEGVR